MKHNTYDPQLPEKLKELQNWFGAIIGRGIDDASRIQPTAPSGQEISEEAKKWILPSPTLEPWERMQIYNQQYWWRLLGILHETLPLLTRLFGYREFNNVIGTPYLEKYPPSHWSLNHLGDKLLQWIDEEYNDEDKELVKDAAAVDLAFNDGFVAQQLKPIHGRDFNDEFKDKPLYLQPHATLFIQPYHMAAFRDEMIQQQDGDYFIEHSFPKLERKETAFIVYRGPNSTMEWQELEVDEGRILQAFKFGFSLSEVLNGLEERETPEKIYRWFERWAAEGWLSLEAPHE